MEVVGENAVETDVRVNNKIESKGTVEDGGRAVLGETDSNEGNEGGGEGTLKSPVVGSVCRVGLGERGWVVDGTLDVGCSLVVKRKMMRKVREGQLERSDSVKCML